MAVTESSVLLSVAYKLRISSLSWRLLPCYSKELEIMSGTELEEPGQLKRAVIDASASAVAGAISRMVTSPLDVIKIRFQVQLEPTASWALTKKDSPLKPKYNDQLL